MLKRRLIFMLASLFLGAALCTAQEVKWEQYYTVKRTANGLQKVYSNPTTYRLYNARTEKFISDIEVIDANFYVTSYQGKWYALGKDAKSGLWGILCSSDWNSWMVEPQYTELRFNYFRFEETGVFLVKKGQDWGILDYDGQPLITCKFKSINANSDGNFFYLGTWEGKQYTAKLNELKQQKKEKAEKAQALAAEKERKAEEARRRAAERKDRETRLASFTRYASAYVQPRMAQWQQKGEFEKVADYQKRVSGENRQRKIDAFTKEAEDLFIKENQEHVKLRATLTLETYDSENEVFSLRSSKFGRLLVPVPISEGPSFKQGFANATLANEKYFVENDKIALAGFDIVVGNKNYHYTNNNALNYSQYQLNPDALDLPAINIVTGSSSASMRKPKVEILSPKSGSQYQQGTVSFRINIVPGDGRQPVLYVEVNGADAVELHPVEQQGKGARVVEGKVYELALPTEPGREVNLSFSARDEQNVISEPQKVRMTYVGQVVKPKLILFAVGVGDYTSGDLTKLRYAAKDARDFTTTIEQANLSDYTGLKKHTYIDQQATRSNINKGLREVLNEARQGDVVMFYFSGHGVQDGSETYFMTIDASSEAPSDEGISFANLKNNMRKLTERQVKVVAFMDACHAGAMVGAKGAAPKLTELDVQNVIEFYSSTTGEESAEDERLQNGIFTAGLISGLRGAAANADGYITVNTLRTYLSDYVREKNSRQTPVFKGVDAGDITLFHKKVNN